MSIRTALRDAQRAAERRMLDTVEAVTVEYVDTGGLNPELVETVTYRGKARISFQSQVTSDAETASQFVTVQRRTIHLPAAAPLLAGKLTLTVTASIDPALIGRKFRIKGKPESGQVSTHRYEVEEVS